MSWRDQLRPGAFRQVPFLVDRHDADWARSVAVHEYPGQNLPDTEDLGELATTFDVDAYVLGDDYMTQRDALVAALSEPGAGSLVHPYLGTVLVVVMGVRLREGNREGGLARFSIRFIRTAAIVPAVEVDTQEAVRETADLAQTASEPQFSRRWPSAAAVRGAVQRAINRVFGPLESLIGAAEDWRDTLQSIINQPAAIWARLTTDLKRIRALADFRRLWSFYDDSSEASHLLSEQMQVSAVIAACAWSAEQTWPSYDEAEAVRSELLEQLDRIAESADDTLYDALVALRAAVASDIERRSADLARLARYTPPETAPALVLAHRLYGPTALESRSDDLVARNRLPHPLFVAGGVELEVLSD
ncbi:hypothetical protein ED208_12675 [Stagnimonas aquatica]|uniref:DNA circulation N-terminal domain-containing protein n=1 Tax=Stagnimonas aquatica TaxID=2689987 RepID=A0A3N0V798_9GAMM|nr:DNA circularization N-terminal domain-containing protein [Stagnimonas aquatica]ROH88667.1 hypothetical protein ED208_12675 [Stagnimonas aquatica]